MATRNITDFTTFVKDGKRRTAYSAGDAVALRFDGWVEETADAKPAAAAKPAASTAPAKQDTNTTR